MLYLRGWPPLQHSWSVCAVKKVLFWVVMVAMGIHPAPSFANIYLARRLDDLISRLAKNYGEEGNSPFLIFKRLLDDLFQIFQGTTKQLHRLYDEINRIHPTLKFTMNHAFVETNFFYSISRHILENRKG